MIEIIFTLYLLLIILVGIFSNRFINSQLDFLLAGRRLGPWVTAFSERASGESAWLLLGLPGAAIAVGYGEVWAVIGIITGIILSWFLIAERLRSETEEYQALTIPDYLHKRFNDSSRIIKTYSSIIIAVFFTFYVSAQFHGSGKILNTIFDIEPLYGISLSAIVIILYTIMGGLLAVAWTDLVQGILMIGTLVILPIVGLMELSSMDLPIKELIMSADPQKSALFPSGLGIFATFSVVVGGLSWGLGYLGQPHLLIRYMAIRSVKDVKQARIIAALWAIPGISGAFLIGVVGMGYFGEDFFIGKDVENVMPMLAEALLPAWLAGLLISGAVAAMMSTADSQLLVSTSAISEDLGIKVSKNDDKLFNSRIVTILLGVFAYLVAMYSEWSGNTIFSIVSFAWSGLGSSFGPVLLLTLWWKGITRQGVIAGLLTGSISTVIWGSSPYLQSIITERFISFALAFLAIVIISKYKKND
ncbi:MAG TPA: sodium/proline symporter [Candidatus Marinimicrobia bacterium]|nr:sodium/proline symporter [Candidatus Neomarinimicrobiota bacterium]|tara:strand:- start:903 stop:2324 length:1422 start_codon:yes stop_codon:yes gene_type:complete